MEQDSQVVPAETPKKLGSLTAVQSLVNEYAKQLAFRYHVDPRHFEIMLVVDPDFDATMKLVGGTIVQIYLQWPESQLTINSLLGRAFELIKKHPIRRTLELVPVAYLLQQQEERLKWKREKFTHEQEIVFDLLPKSRILKTEKVTTILEDAQTGESIEITQVSKKQRFNGEDVRMWMDLSRIVRDKYPPLEVEEEHPELKERKGI